MLAMFLHCKERGVGELDIREDEQELRSVDFAAVRLSRSGLRYTAWNVAVLMFVYH